MFSCGKRRFYCPKMTQELNGYPERRHAVPKSKDGGTRNRERLSLDLMLYVIVIFLYFNDPSTSALRAYAQDEWQEGGLTCFHM